MDDRHDRGGRTSVERADGAHGDYADISGRSGRQMEHGARPGVEGGTGLLGGGADAHQLVDPLANDS